MDAEAHQTAIAVVAVVAGRGSAPSTIHWAAREAALRQGRLLVVDAPRLDPSRAASPSDDRGPGRRPAEGGWLSRQTASVTPGVTLETVGDEGSRAALAIRRIRAATHAPVVAVPPVSRSLLSALVFGPNRHEQPLHDPATVVVVPPSSRADTTGPVSVGFHGTAGSASALRWAVDEAGRRGASVVAVMVWSERELDEVAGCVRVDPRLCALPGHYAARLLGTALEQSRVALDAVTPVVRRGMPAHLLLTEASRSALLVVGAGDLLVHGYRVLGPIAGACASRSAVPVAIVPPG